MKCDARHVYTGFCIEARHTEASADDGLDESLHAFEASLAEGAKMPVASPRHYRTMSPPKGHVTRNEISP